MLPLAPLAAAIGAILLRAGILFRTGRFPELAKYSADHRYPIFVRNAASILIPGGSWLLWIAAASLLARERGPWTSAVALVAGIGVLITLILTVRSFFQSPTSVIARQSHLSMAARVGYIAIPTLLIGIALMLSLPGLRT